MLPTSLLFCESPVLGLVAVSAPILAYYNGYFGLSIAFAIVFVFLLLFYRYYEHTTRYSDNVVVCPCDGTVTHISYSGGYCYVSVFLSPFDIHTQMYPVNGTVVSRVYDQTGKFGLATDLDKCRDNEKKIHLIKMANGSLVRMTQIAGFLPRRITSSDVVPEKVLAGEYLGMIKFGSRVDLVFECLSRCVVAVGDRVTHGDLFYDLKN